jgi:hypothetical protein
MNFESLALVGAPFEHVETYVYYDGRRTFAMRSVGWPDLYYVVNTVDEDDETGDLVTLAVALNGDRFRAMRSGVVPFREVFAGASRGSLFRIDWTWNDDDEPVPAITPMSGADLPPRWLPTATARLSLPTATVEAYEPSKLVALSKAQSRTLFAVEVEHEGKHSTEFPARNAGELQVAIDGAIVSLAREHVAKGKSKSPVARELSVSVIELQAASFVLVMAIDSAGMVEATDVTSEVFGELSSFVEAVASGEGPTVLSALKRHSSKTRNRLRDMLRPLAAVGSGITLSTSIAHTHAVQAVSASPVTVRAAVELIEKMPPETKYADVRRGVLTGLVLRTQHFEIIDAATGDRYSGAMTDDATAEANGFAVGSESFVTARIRIDTPLTNDDEETTGVKHVLEAIAAFDAGANRSDGDDDA